MFDKHHRGVAERDGEQHQDEGHDADNRRFPELRFSDISIYGYGRHLFLHPAAINAVLRINHRQVLLEMDQFYGVSPGSCVNRWSTIDNTE
jgi:hypothetical protein